MSRWVLIVFVLLFVNSVFAVERETVAVLDFAVGNEADAGLSVPMAEELSARVLDSGLYIVISRRNIKDVLSEQGFTQTGVCDEESCRVLAGRLLGAQKIVSGTLSRLDRESYQIAVRLIDVESGKIEKIVTELVSRHKKDILGRLGVVADKLISVPERKKGSLSITGPEGTELYLNGEKKGKLPWQGKNLPAGFYNLKAISSGHRDFIRQVAVKSDITTNITVRPEAIAGRLEITSNLTGAAVFIDGKMVGRTNFTDAGIAIGAHSIEIKAGKNYRTYKKELTIRENETQKLEVQLAPKSGTLLVESKPVGAKIYFHDVQYTRHKDQKKGEAVITPSRLTLPSGRYLVEVRLKGYTPVRSKVEIADGVETRVGLDLKLVSGIIKLYSEPPGLKVFLRGLGHYTTPAVIHDVPPGFYAAEFDVGDGKVVTRELEIRDSEPVQALVTLKNKK